MAAVATAINHKLFRILFHDEVNLFRSLINALQAYDMGVIDGLEDGDFAVQLLHELRMANLLLHNLHGHQFARLAAFRKSNGAKSAPTITGRRQAYWPSLWLNS